MKSKKVLLIGLFIAGFSLVMYPIIAKYFHQQSVNEMLTHFKNNNIIENKVHAEGKSEIHAMIEIPGLGLELPIFIGATEENLRKGIGVIEGTNLPGGGQGNHSVLAGHSGLATAELFSNIHTLSSGDLFYIHSPNGILTYEIKEQKKIKATATEYLEPQEGKDLVTLLTCPIFRSDVYRIIVIGERIK